MGNCSLLISQPSEYLLHITTSIIQNNALEGNISLDSTGAVWHTPSRVVALYQEGRIVKNCMVLHAPCCPGSYLQTIIDFLATRGEKTGPCLMYVSTGVYPRDGTLLVTAVPGTAGLAQEPSWRTQKNVHVHPSFIQIKSNFSSLS